MMNDKTHSELIKALESDDDEEDDGLMSRPSGVFENAEKNRAKTAGQSFASAVLGWTLLETCRQNDDGERKVWKTWVVTSDNPRASHAAMNGETVPYGEPFSNGAQWPADIDALDIEEVEADELVGAAQTIDEAGPALYHALVDELLEGFFLFAHAEVEEELVPEAGVDEVADMIHVICGAPCSGKSTYVKENAKDGDLRIDYDVIAQALGATKSHEADGLIKQAAFDAREGAIKTALADPDSESWIIHTSPSEEHLKMYEEVGADIVELDVGYEECIARAERDDRPQQTFDGIEKWYSRQKGGHKVTVKTKTFEAKSDNGVIVGYASTWTREPDSYGDVVAKGAFAEYIEQLKAEGRVLPFLLNHDAYNIRLAKFSFAYDVLDQEEVELEDGRKANELRKLNIHEVSLVLYPANPDTSVVSVKAGRRNRKTDEDIIKEIINLANSLLNDEEDINEPTEEESKAKAEELDTVNAEEQERVTQLLKEANELLNKEV